LYIKVQEACLTNGVTSLFRSHSVYPICDLDSEVPLNVMLLQLNMTQGERNHTEALQKIPNC